MTKRDDSDPLYSYGDVKDLPSQWNKTGPTDGYPNENDVIRFFEHDLYRDTARVPRGLTPRVNRVSYMTHPTVSTNTVATWIKDLNPKQLRAVARNATPLKTHALGVVRRVLSGRGGATDPHGHTACSGVNSNRPISGRSRGIKFACVHPPVSGRHGQNGEASGLDPEVLHECAVVIETNDYGFHVYLADTGSERIYHVISDKITEDDVNTENVHDRFAEYAAINMSRWWADRNRDPSRYLP